MSKWYKDMEVDRLQNDIHQLLLGISFLLGYKVEKDLRCKFLMKTKCNKLHGPVICEDFENLVSRQEANTT